MKYKDRVVEMLFNTNAFRVAPKDEPFWYASCEVGPFYINTHFLYGSEKEASKLLEIIDNVKDDIFNCPKTILNFVKENYNNNDLYRELINIALDYIKRNVNLKNIEYISGGERRDWFFSLIIADLLDMKHITIYKNKKIIITYKGHLENVSDLENKKVFHIADLITKASSYKSVWIPAIKENNGTINNSLVIVDRNQGGYEVLEEEGINSHCLIKVDNEFFNRAKNQKLITDSQKDFILEYLKNPKETMENFLKENPEFLKNALRAGDIKIKLRAKQCIEKKIYRISN
ncbi:MAG: orotate phosphoribosyltransferase [Clostridiales bacterium]